MPRLAARLAALALAAAITGLAPARADDELQGGRACLHARLDALPSQAGDRTRAAEFDDATGRSLLNFPPSPLVEYQRLRLDLVVPDMNQRRLDAVATYTLTPLGRALDRLVLAVGPPANMSILDVRADLLAASAPPLRCDRSHDGETLTLRFDPPLPVGIPTRLQIVYTVTDPPEGLVWTPESPESPGRAAQFHSQGQAESNHYWFPCHDFPNVRMATEIAVSVPKGFLACSNGVLASRAATPGRPGFETFHWVQDQSHVPYLVSLVVGRFDVVDVGTSRLPMPVYAPAGKGDLVRQTYGRTPRMVALFERLTGRPYPWAKYAHAIVHNFNSGGMENTSATTMFDTAVLDRTALLDGDLDGLISHELAHQWFGDLITCRSWEHIWLNEGFATYFTALWFEHRDGPVPPTPDRDAYQAAIWDDFREVIDGDRAEAPAVPGMCSKVYRHPWETFRRAANPYPKGASILHMLRMRLGDDTFFKGIALYVERHAGRTVETSDFRKAMEEVSGLSLLRFFDQWCFRPGVPRIAIRPSWDAAAGRFTLDLEQTQNIDADNPAFAVEVPVLLARAGRAGAWLRVPMDQRTASVSIPLDAPPDYLVVDPAMNVLAVYDVAQPADAWLACLASGPTLASRLRALEAIAALPPDALPADAAARVASVAREERTETLLRRSAVAALGRLRARDVLLAMTRRWPDSAPVRRAVVEHLAALAAADGAPPDPAVVAILADRFARDPSYAVRAEAVRRLGVLRAPEATEVVAQALRTESQHDQIRQAALEALASLDAPEGLGPAIDFTARRWLPRTRQAAVKAVATLGHHDPDRAVALLASLLSDKPNRVAREAAEGLARFTHPGALEALDRAASESPGRIVRTEAARLAADLRDRPPEPALPDAPHSTVVAPMRWYPVLRVEDWYAPDDKDAAFTHTADYFAARDMVVEQHDGRFYVLCWTDPDRSITPLTGDWGFDPVTVSRDPAGRPTVGLSLNPAANALIGDFTQRHLGRFMAIIVDGHVLRAPKIVSRIADRMVLTGQFDDDSAAAVALRIRKGPVEFRLAVAPGELAADDDRELRARFRQHGP
jgi:aminopeptidase N